MAEPELGPVTVNGKPVEIPDILTVNLDEAEVMYDLYGVELDKIGNGSSAPKLKVLRALLHVGVQRLEPDASTDDVKAAVGQLQLAALMAAVKIPELAGEDDARPPALSKSSSGSSGTSGRASAKSSGRPAPARRGISGTRARGTSA